MSARLLNRLDVHTRNALRNGAEMGRDVAPLLARCRELSDGERERVRVMLLKHAERVREAKRVEAEEMAAELAAAERPDTSDDPPSALRGVLTYGSPAWHRARADHMGD